MKCMILRFLHSMYVVMFYVSGFLATFSLLLVIYGKCRTQDTYGPADYVAMLIFFILSCFIARLFGILMSRYQRAVYQKKYRPGP